MCGFGAQSSLLESISAADGSERNACERACTNKDGCTKGEREREFRGGNRRRGRGSILHGQRTISMHEAHWSYSFLSTQNTYLHFGLCTGVSLLVFHVHLSSSSCFSVSLSLSLSLSSVHILVIRLTVSILVHYSRFLGSSSLSLSKASVRPSPSCPLFISFPSPSRA